jgi:hypothetical protein
MANNDNEINRKFDEVTDELTDMAELDIKLKYRKGEL